MRIDRECFRLLKTPHFDVLWLHTHAKRDVIPILELEHSNILSICSGSPTMEMVY